MTKEEKAEYGRKYWEANRERIAESRRKYYEANHEKVGERDRKYREANREKRAENNRKYWEANRERIAEKARKYREANPEKIRERDRKYRAANREKIVKRARKSRGLPEPTRPKSPVCECCSGPPGKRALHLDHCHKSEKFRGWLCGNCNTAIGRFGDSIEGLQKAIDYLRRFEDEC